MEHKPYFRHRELMNELDIQTNKLPDNLKNYVVKFNQKIRFAKNPEIIQDCQNFSELIADEIETWYDTQEITHSNETFESGGEISNNDVVEENEPIERVEPIEKVEPIERVERVEPIERVERVENSKEENKEPNSWGLNLNW